MILNPSLPPCENFKLTNWKLTIPDGSEVSTAKLLDGFERPGTFFTDPQTGGMVFRCPNIGGTTTNTKYSRCELREMLAPGGSADAPENNWTPERGGVLRARLRVDRGVKIVIGQIHGPEAEPIRLYWHNGRVYAGLDSSDNKPSFSKVIMDGIPLGERFGYEIQLHRLNLFGVIRKNGGNVRKFAFKIDPGYLGQPCYWKAGNYNQCNEGDDYAQVTFFKLTTGHP